MDSGETPTNQIISLKTDIQNAGGHANLTIFPRPIAR